MAGPSAAPISVRHSYGSIHAQQLEGRAADVLEMLSIM
jgi:hypothetical protein